MAATLTLPPVKRAIRALHSEAYEKARAKNQLLPPVTDRASAENAFKLLPLSLLALRVSKYDPHEGHGHGKKKRVKGLWTVRVEQQQNADDDSHYVWLYEGSQWKQKLYALLALVAVFAVVMFPLWPLVMRQGVWYLSMGMLGLIGLFFAMAIFRLILFCITVFIVPPGLWLYPNLFEDVGFFDSFRPVWAWQEVSHPLPFPSLDVQYLDLQSTMFSFNTDSFTRPRKTRRGQRKRRRRKRRKGPRRSRLRRPQLTTTRIPTTTTMHTDLLPALHQLHLQRRPREHSPLLLRRLLIVPLLQRGLHHRRERRASGCKRALRKPMTSRWPGVRCVVFSISCVNNLRLRGKAGRGTCFRKVMGGSNNLDVDHPINPSGDQLGPFGLGSTARIAFAHLSLTCGICTSTPFSRSLLLLRSRGALGAILLLQRGPGVVE